MNSRQFTQINFHLQVISSLVVFLLSIYTFGQGISINGTNNATEPHPSAILDLQSDSKGFLPTRMTTNQRDAIQQPLEGLTIYNTSINCLEFFNGTTWVSLCNSQQPEFQCGNNFGYNGVQYKTIQIGTQCWFQENLRTDKYKDNTLILVAENEAQWNAMGNASTGLYGIYPHTNFSNLNSDEQVAAAYGFLYNWFAVRDNNICPEGWSVPTHNDWLELERYVCEQSGNSNCNDKFPQDATDIGWFGSNEGKALKSCRTEISGLCPTTEHPRWNNNAVHFGTDAYNFSIVPAGLITTSGSYISAGTMAFFWTRTPHSNFNYAGWGHDFSFTQSQIARYYDHKNYGFSVRCIKN